MKTVSVVLLLLSIGSPALGLANPGTANRISIESKKILSDPRAELLKEVAELKAKIAAAPKDFEPKYDLSLIYLDTDLQPLLTESMAEIYALIREGLSLLEESWFLVWDQLANEPSMGDAEKRKAAFIAADLGRLYEFYGEFVTEKYNWSKTELAEKIVQLETKAYSVYPKSTAVSWDFVWTIRIHRYETRGKRLNADDTKRIPMLHAEAQQVNWNDTISALDQVLADPSELIDESITLAPSVFYRTKLLFIIQKAAADGALDQLLYDKTMQDYEAHLKTLGLTLRPDIKQYFDRALKELQEDFEAVVP